MTGGGEILYQFKRQIRADVREYNGGGEQGPQVQSILLVFEDLLDTGDEGDKRIRDDA